MKNPTKQQEVDRLTSYAKRIRSEIPNSYLASLFNERLVDWFAAQVRSDVCTDVMSIADAYHKQVGEARRAQTEVDRLNDFLNAQNDEAERREDKIRKDAADQVEAAEVKSGSLELMNTYLRLELEREESKSREFCENYCQADREIQQLKAELNALKVELCDYVRAELTRIKQAD